jgi:sugar phosphate permease
MSLARESKSASVKPIKHRAFGRAHRWKVLGVGFAANASFAAAFYGIPTTAVFIRSGYQIETTHLGLVLGAMGLGTALSELPWGLLTDRLGDRKVLLSGLGLTGVVLGWLALFVAPLSGHVPSFTLLTASLLLVGLIGGSVNGSSGRAVMAWFKDGERGFAMSIRQTALAAGGAIGALILPSTAAVAGFQAVYSVLAALCLVTTFFVWLWLHESPVEELISPATTRPSENPARGPLRNGQVWRTAFGLGALNIPPVAVLTFAAVFLNDFGHLSLAAISASIVAVQIGAVIARIWSGRFTDRRKNRRSFLKACALVTAALYGLLSILVAAVSAMPQQSSILIPVIVLTLVAGGITASCWHGIAFTELATIAGMKHVGTALGLGNTFAFGAYFLAPLAIPYVLGTCNWTCVWAMTVSFALIAFVLFPATRRQ